MSLSISSVSAGTWPPPVIMERIFVPRVFFFMTYLTMGLSALPSSFFLMPVARALKNMGTQ